MLEPDGRPVSAVVVKYRPAAASVEPHRSRRVDVSKVKYLSTREAMVMTSMRMWEESVPTRLEGGDGRDQLTCTVNRSRNRIISTCDRRADRVNLVYPSCQETFARLVQLYLEVRGAEVTLGRNTSCSRHLVLLPREEGQEVGAWVEEVHTIVSRGERVVGVVEERGEWRRTDPWINLLNIQHSLLWVHDYQEACVDKAVEKLNLFVEEEREGLEDLDELDEDLEELGEEDRGRVSRRGQELWGTLRKNLLGKRSLSVDSGYNSD